MNANEEVIRSGKSRKDWYREIYLKSDHWKHLRLLAIRHHGKKCHDCGRKKNLDVHHLNYRHIYDVTIHDLQVLCRVCHMKEHGEILGSRPSKTKSKKKLSRKHRKWLKRQESLLKRKNKTTHQRHHTIDPNNWLRQKAIEMKKAKKLKRMAHDNKIPEWASWKNGTFMSDMLQKKRELKENCPF